MVWKRLRVKVLATSMVAGWFVCAPSCAPEFDAAQQPSPTNQPSSSQPPAAAAPQATQPVQRAPAQAPSVLGRPPVEFNPPTLNLGTVKPSGNASGAVMIYNTSDQPLTIKASRASCSCTTINLADTTIPPGQAVSLDVAYHASSLMGARSETVRILFHGYDVIEVPVIVTVGLPVRSEPAFIDALKHADGTQTLNGQFTVFALDQKPFRVLAVNGKPAVFANFDPETDEPRNSYILKWDLSGFDQGTCKDASGERFPRWIIVETDHPDAPVFDLEVRNECNLRSRVSPSTPMDTWAISDKRALLGGLKPGEPVEVDVQVNWLPKRDRESPPSALVSESAQFTAEWVGVTEGEDGMMLRMRITPAKDARGLIYGTVRVHSSRQSAPVAVIGTVR